MNNILLEIDDKTFDSTFDIPNTSKFKKRSSSRGILILNDKIALLNVTKDGFHKLPGGGFENFEGEKEAFIREVLEETGCKCEVLDYAGEIIETRSKFSLVQISYVFLAKVIGKPLEPQFDEGEIGAGFALEWKSIEEAEKLFDSEKPGDYEGKFINLRDKTILTHYKTRSFYLSQ